jgi:hemerythrin-like metal-binding domain
MNKQWSMFGLALLLLVIITIILLGFMVSLTNPVSWTLIVVLALVPYIHKRMVANRFVEWHDSYSVGIEAIDNDHKKLLNLINQLQTAAHYQTDPQYEREAFDALVDYTKTHFKREEELMEANGYPTYAAHKGEHEAMIAQVNEMLQRYQAKPHETIEEAVQFLKKWLVGHINGTDQGYSQFLRDKGVR